MEPTQERIIDAPAATVWAVLADGWRYSGWVVGASRIRNVDDSWPDAGSNLYQSVGIWPILVDDRTTVIRADPPNRLELQVRSRPFGQAHVVLRLEEQSGRTRVQMAEQVTRGIGRWVPPRMQAPLMNWRNSESLRRLAHLAERGAAQVSAS